MDDTLKALKEDMLAFIDPGVAENDIEHTVSVEHHNFLRWFDALDRLSAQQREPVVRVKELEWTSVFGRPATRAESLSSIGLYIIADLDGTERFSVGLDNGACAAFLLDEAGNKQLRYSSIHEAAAAAQADYEARIMAAIEIAPQSDRQPLPGQKQISETGKELPENAEQPMNNADVSVGELAGFFVTEFPHLLTMSTQIEVARALLARYRIVRLDRLESSGRRG